MRKLIWLVCVVVATTGCGGGGSSSGGAVGDWKITSAGGTFKSQNHAVTVVVPPGAVASDKSVHESPLESVPTNPGLTYVFNTGYQYSHVAFSSPATLTALFEGTTLTTAQEHSLTFYKMEDGTSTWTPVTTTTNHAEKTASAQISSFSSYALFYNSQAQ
jgi:hypothetical protein